MFLQVFILTIGQKILFGHFFPLIPKLQYDTSNSPYLCKSLPPLIHSTYKLGTGRGATSPFHFNSTSQNSSFISFFLNLTREGRIIFPLILERVEGKEKGLGGGTEEIGMWQRYINWLHPTSTLGWGSDLQLRYVPL